jgi:hypothetical protein
MTIVIPEPPHFQTIPQFTPWGRYCVDIGWNYLESTLASWTEENALDLDPDFQRGHVWTTEQRSAFVEYVLRGGRVRLDILFNCPGWHVGEMGQIVLVDGKQRLESVRMFLRNELRVFGYYRNEFAGVLRITHASFKFYMNDLPTREDVLNWYLELNTGGTPHTEEEIEKVRHLLAKEKEK